MAQVRNNWLRFLSQKETERIHAAALEILGETGVRIESTEMVHRLLDEGCNKNKGRVLFSVDLVEKALAGFEPEIHFSSRTGNAICVKDGNLFTHTGGSIPFVHDLETGKRRTATLADLEDMIRLMNSLENLDMPGGLVLPSDVPPAMAEMRMVEMLLRHSQKPISGIGVSSAAQAPFMKEMYRAAAQTGSQVPGHHLADVGISPESPLYYPEEIIRIMEIFISEGIPVCPLVAPIVGVTAPMTIAGGLAQMHASMLAFAVMSHLINPKTPVIYGARLAFANMRTACSIWGLPEVGLAGACSVLLARHCGFLSDVYGLSGSPAAYDNQLGYEKAINGILPVLAGANIVSGFGGFVGGLLASFEQLVIDNECFGAIHKASLGVMVNQDRLAAKSVAAAMDGESFLLQDHTLEYLRKNEVFEPKLGFSGLLNDWDEMGGKDIRVRAKEEVRRRLAAHRDVPLSPETEKEFARILKAAEKTLL